MKIVDGVVTIEQETKGVNGKVTLHQVYDFSKTTRNQMIQWAVANRIIAWRAYNDVKSRTIEQLSALSTDIDCTENFESTRRVKVDDPFMTLLREKAVILGITVEEMYKRIKEME